MFVKLEIFWCVSWSLIGLHAFKYGYAFNDRYQLQDWDGKLLGEANAEKDAVSAFQPFPLHIGIKRDWTLMDKVSF